MSCTDSGEKCQACAVTKANDYYVDYYVDYYAKYFEKVCRWRSWSGGGAAPVLDAPTALHGGRTTLLLALISFDACCARSDMLSARLVLHVLLHGTLRQAVRQRRAHQGRGVVAATERSAARRAVLSLCKPSAPFRMRLSSPRTQQPQHYLRACIVREIVRKSSHSHRISTNLLHVFCKF